ncbi:MAG: PEP-CTERM sorting domain-containing protein [Scytolyngbya sp. HA4215-MV1]|jgi:hypothetical protein|nr:PEP-CTERM sorting domain-containing protein [Scytolyngbya sp. HA4215-MV1]
MKFSKLALCLSGALILGFAPVFTSKANATSLNSGWTYSIDAANDGSGGNGFEIKGIAMSIQNDQIVVALTGGMPVTGTAYSHALDGIISWGDLFLNFTGNSFNAAQGSLFGIHFGSNTNSSLAAGVYSNVKTTSVATINSGYSSLQQYYNAGYGKANSVGAALPTQTAALNYFGGGSIQTSIASGTKIGNITPLLASNLTAAGLNFGSAQGTQTFGFSFSKSLLPQGSFLSNLFLECGNDGVAIAASTQSVPEPTTMAGLALVGLGMTAVRRKRKAASESAA